MFTPTMPANALEPMFQGLPELAEQSIGLSDPNPRVACRLVLANGAVFEGHTQAAGLAHAEAMALQAAQVAGASTQGAHAIVTLEPCSHQGRTPPCADALVRAGVARVTIALQDPNPLVSGQGIARLRAAGVQVDLLPTDHPLALHTRELNVGFLHRMRTGLPWVRMKMAASMDGVTALPNGVSQWITSQAARTDGHAWRRRAGAVLTGIGTVLEDDPRLDVRLVPTIHQPVRVVVDSQLETPPSARIVQPPGAVWIYSAADLTQQARSQQALQAAGVHITHCPGPRKTPGGPAKVDLRAMLADLGQRHINELHLEAGHKLNGSFLREGLVNEVLLYLAPTLLGQGAGLSNLGPLQALDQGVALQWVSAHAVGADLCLRARHTPLP
jgi:diaminohydroxyphosphoribosylaminopyrimidine deaminase / 5-amino-6-(5-phosphoribosylamino)uracil reductase